jgi:hypothetical protein
MVRAAVLQQLVALAVGGAVQLVTPVLVAPAYSALQWPLRFADVILFSPPCCTNVLA